MPNNWLEFARYACLTTKATRFCSRLSRSVGQLKEHG